MFGPSEMCLGKYGFAHHRSKAHGQMVRDTQDLFRERFNVPDSMAILFVNGCGTLANEIVLSSWQGVFRPMSSDGEFQYRLDRLIRSFSWRAIQNRKILTYGVGYETAVSGETLEYILVNEHDDFVFEDAVSAFPYYDPWPEADVWTTVCGKQLGCQPGLAVIVASRDFCHSCDRRGLVTGSCLSLYERYAVDSIDHQDVHTPASGLILELQSRLEGFNLAEHRAMIDARRGWLDAILGEHSIGEGPVYTVKAGVLSDNFIDSWGLYRGMSGPQFFLHWGRNEDYKQVCCALRKELGA